MTEFTALIAKTYSCLKDDFRKIKNQKKGTKKGAIKRKLKFENYKYCLENNVNLKNKLDVNGLKESDKEVIKKIITKSQQKRKSEKHNVLTQAVNNITLDSNDD